MAMECNRDEALRAKSIAENKFLAKDIQGAKKFALKAQNLYPGLDGISQMLSTFDVYLSAESKINGETNWYSVLSINSSADDEMVKKQYRKLALTLHPDKNKAIGAEGAFKLLSEAWSVLSDKGRRALYDQKTKVRSSQPSRDSSTMNGFCGPKNDFVAKAKKPTASHAPTPPKSQPQPQPSVPKPTFWTACHRCRMQYEYHRKYLNHNLLCPNCHEPFVALETQSAGVPAHAVSWASTATQNTYPNPAGKAAFDYFAGKPNFGNSLGGANANYGHGSSLDPNQKKFQWGAFSWSGGAVSASATSSTTTTTPTHAANMVQMAFEKAKKEREAAQAAQAANMARLYEKAKKEREAAQVSHGAQSAQAPQAMRAAADGQPVQTSARKEDFQKPPQPPKRANECMFNRFPNSVQNVTEMLRVEQAAKRAKGSENTGKPESGSSELHQTSMSKKNVSDAERMHNIQRGQFRWGRELSSADVRAMLLEKSKKSIASKINEIKLEKEKNKEKMSKASESPENLGDPVQEEKQKYQGEPTEDIGSEKMQPISISYPDPEFHDFDKDRSKQCFDGNQVWAAYDDDDGMPRYYALIQKVISLKPFKMRFSWLNSKSNVELGLINWVACGFAKTCGEFRIGRYEISTSPSIFSHRVQCEKGTRGILRIFPKKGEVWALFKNWSRDWNETTPDEIIHKYEMVEVLEDYDDGVLVAPMVKVAGFRTIFHRHMDPGMVKKIPREEMFRLSHQVPSRLLTGEEGKGAPKGCRELDPASTPLELLNVIAETKDDMAVTAEQNATK